MYNPLYNPTNQGFFIAHLEWHTVFWINSIHVHFSKVKIWVGKTRLSKLEKFSGTGLDGMFQKGPLETKKPFLVWGFTNSWGLVKWSWRIGLHFKKSIMAKLSWKLRCTRVKWKDAGSIWKGFRGHLTEGSFDLSLELLCRQDEQPLYQIDLVPKPGKQNVVCPHCDQLPWKYGNSGSSDVVPICHVSTNLWRCYP